MVGGGDIALTSGDSSLGFWRVRDNDGLAATFGLPLWLLITCCFGVSTFCGAGVWGCG